MSKHLKNIVIDALQDRCATFVQLPPSARPHAKSVRYFTLATGIDILYGAMDMQKDGAQRRKRIIVRPSRFHHGLHELYTYHFPKHWSEACVANREIIKEAQRQAHALEHDYSREGLEWRLRFFTHYFNVFKLGKQPAPGLKRYSRFYQYVYVCIYRNLKQQQARQAAQQTQQVPTTVVSADEVTFEPIIPRSVVPSARPFPLRNTIPSGRVPSEFTFASCGPYSNNSPSFSQWRCLYLTLLT